MLDSLLSIIAPHYCYGCGKTGQLLCDNCKYNIISEPYGRCIVCEHPTMLDALCRRCSAPYGRAWCVGDRQAELKSLIDGFKFHNIKAAYKPLGELIHRTLPELPASTRLVPVPTVASHIRQRGYDHTLLIARHVGALRRLTLSTVLERATTTKQREASRHTRIEQAKVAFCCPEKLDSSIPYLLIDDVMTTGATLKYAAKTLRDAGAVTIWVVTVARQGDFADPAL